MVELVVVSVAAMIELAVLAGIGMAPSTAVGAKLIWPPTGMRYPPVAQAAEPEPASVTGALAPPGKTYWMVTHASEVPVFAMAKRVLYVAESAFAT